MNQLENPTKLTAFISRAEDSIC